MRIYGFVNQKVSLGIETHYFTAGAVTRIDSQYTLLSQWCSKQQLSQIIGKHANRFLVRFFFRQVGKFGFNRWFQQSFVSIGYGQFHLVGAGIVAVDEKPFQALDGLFAFRSHRNAQKTFILATAHGHQPVRRTFLQRFFPVEIIVVFGAFLFLSFNYFTGNKRTVFKLTPHNSAGTFVFVDPFGNNVAGSGKRLVQRFNLIVYKRLCPAFQVVFVLLHNDFRQKLQSFFTGNHGTSAAFGLVRKVNIFQLSRIKTIIDAFLQFGCQLFLLLNGF